MTEAVGLRSIRRHISGKALVAVIFWGASFVVTRVALESWHPVGLVSARLWMGLTLIGTTIVLLRRPLLPDRRDWPACILLGLVLGVHLLLQAFGLLYTTAVRTGFIIGLIPVPIAIAAHLFGRQRLNATGWGGVALGAAGMLLVTTKSLDQFADARFGDALQVISCFTWAFYTVYGSRAVSRNGALRVTFASIAVAAVVCTIAGFKTGFTVRNPDAFAWLSAAFLGFICNGVAYFLWVKAVDEQGPTRVGAMIYFEPFITLLVAVVTIHERVAIQSLIGGVIIVAGVLLVARGSRQAMGLPGES
ncbi:MAG: DMT family transporter [Phycisphaerales bacterium]|nr:DMT family transporter [Phycisphaerales bacterium]